MSRILSLFVSKIKKNNLIKLKADLLDGDGRAPLTDRKTLDRVVWAQQLAVAKGLCTTSCQAIAKLDKNRESWTKRYKEILALQERLKKLPLGKAKEKQEKIKAALDKIDLLLNPKQTWVQSSLRFPGDVASHLRALKKLTELWNEVWRGTSALQDCERLALSEKTFKKEKKAYEELNTRMDDLLRLSFEEAIKTADLLKKEFHYLLKVKKSLEEESAIVSLEKSAIARLDDMEKRLDKEYKKTSKSGAKSKPRPVIKTKKSRQAPAGHTPLHREDEEFQSEAHQHLETPQDLENFQKSVAFKRAVAVNTKAGAGLSGFGNGFSRTGPGPLKGQTAHPVTSTPFKIPRPKLFSIEEVSSRGDDTPYTKKTSKGS